jgi:hypothetical protein
VWPGLQLLRWGTDVPIDSGKLACAYQCVRQGEVIGIIDIRYKEVSGHE